ncbi:MAG: erythronate-4-phosphate dehydrogenase [Gammaproteobacteria bacterium]|nr:MAG: erythronate-4-phosphate dehydrogenase [Gammaproteobacteria bacterium]
MKILADENIPHIKELFSELAEIVTCDGRKISPDKLADVDVLLVRSVTRVNQQLLENSAVKFVGTATIGLDHLDLNWLKKNNIAYANAKQCNSIAVAEYVLSGLFVFADTFNIDLRKSKIGIIGGGSVGSALAERLEVMGIPHCISDPLLQKSGDKRDLVCEQALADCEFITAHVPLTTKHESDWPTEGMINGDFFKSMKSMRYFINTARGNIIEPSALKTWLSSSKENQCIIDVWRDEPNIDCELLEKCFLATPHIAGHTREGKTRGTLMLFHAFCKQFELEDNLLDEDYLKKDLPKDLIKLKQEQTFLQALSSAIWQVYDIRDDDKALRAGLSKDITKHFDRLRKGYKIRREFSAHCLCPLSTPDGSRRTLRELGFRSADPQESLS